MALAVETNTQQVLLIEEVQNFIKNTIAVTLAHFDDKKITGSPRELVENRLLMQRMKKTHLARLSFLAEIERQEAVERKRQLLKAARK